MGWKKIRIDFAPEVKCQLCHRYIYSGKAIIIMNDNGEYAYSGPHCAKDPIKVDNPTDKLIDITKGCIEEHSNNHNNSGSQRAKKQNDLEDAPISLDFDDYLDTNAAKAYLILRFEKLTHIPTITKLNSEKLASIYQRYKSTGVILSNEENYLKTVMYGTKYPKFSYKNLQSVYATDFWLHIFMTKNSDHKFATSLQSYLHSYLTLSDKQMDKLNECFSEQKNMKVKLKNLVN